METTIPESIFIRRLALHHRVLLLGGMAVIAHGKSRHTKDFDIWLEPQATSADWANALLCVTKEFPVAYAWSLVDRRVLGDSDLINEVEDFGVLRIAGFHLPIDVFRRPNGFSEGDFEEIWSHAAIMEDGVGLPDEVDLHVTKSGTGRHHDFDDQAFLESKIRTRYRERLTVCDAAEASALFARFLDPNILEIALTNPHPEVREITLGHLHEFEAEGDPYSRDILAVWARQGTNES